MPDEIAYFCRWGFCHKTFDSPSSLHEHVSRHIEVAQKVDVSGIKRRKVGRGIWLRIEGVHEVEGEGMRVLSGFQRISDQLPVHDSQAGDTTTTTDTTYPIPSFPSLPPPPSFPTMSQQPFSQSQAQDSFSAFDHLDGADSAALLGEPFARQMSEGMEQEHEHEDRDVYETEWHAGNQTLDDIYNRCMRSPSDVPRPEGGPANSQHGESGHVVMDRRRGKDRTRSRSSSPFVPPTQALMPTQLASQAGSSTRFLSPTRKSVTTARWSPSQPRSRRDATPNDPPSAFRADHFAAGSPPSVEMPRSAVAPPAHTPNPLASPHLASSPVPLRQPFSQSTPSELFVSQSMDVDINVQVDADADLDMVSTPEPVHTGLAQGDTVVTAGPLGELAGDTGPMDGLQTDDVAVEGNTRAAELSPATENPSPDSAAPASPSRTGAEGPTADHAPSPDPTVTHNPSTIQSQPTPSRIIIQGRSSTGGTVIPMPAPPATSVPRLSVGFTFGSGFATPPV